MDAGIADEIAGGLLAPFVDLGEDGMRPIMVIWEGHGGKGGFRAVQQVGCHEGDWNSGVAVVVKVVVVLRVLSPVRTGFTGFGFGSDG